MGKVASRLTRKELKFMAEDIGPDLVAVMDPKDVVAVMNTKDVVAALNPKDIVAAMSPKDIVAGIANLNIEELLKGLSPEKQKALLDSLLKRYSTTVTDEMLVNS